MRYRQEMLRSNYAAGDYFHGGYYPAGGFFKNLLKTAAPIVGGALKTAFPQAAAGLAIFKGLTGGAKSPAAQLATMGSQVLGGSGGASPFAGKLALGGKKGSFTPGQGMLLGSGGGHENERGYHLSRKAGHWVKNRHMNPLNPRALRRGMHRVQSFARFARKTINFTHRVKMKKHRRRA